MEGARISGEKEAEVQQTVHSYTCRYFPVVAGQLDGTNCPGYRSRDFLRPRKCPNYQGAKLNVNVLKRFSVKSSG